MSTCRELAAQLEKETDVEAKAALQEQLNAREKSHRDPLKAKEKSLRGKESTTLKELIRLQEECEKELSEDDSILKRVRASVSSKESQWQEVYDAKLSSKKGLTYKVLDELMGTVEKELGLATSDTSKDLIKRVSSLLEARRKSHRSALAKELASVKDTATMKDLAKLKQKMLLELSDTDDVVKDLISLEKARDATVRSKLVSRFTGIIKDLKKTKSSAIHDFLKECEDELDENDPLLSQVRSTLETKMLESKGMKQVHNMDDLERGEREKVTDDAPVARPSKKSSSTSKSDTTPSKKKGSSSKSGKSSLSSSLGKPSIVTNAVEVLSGFKNDLSGAPPSSALYKLGLILVFLMYIAIVGYSTSLAFKVAKFDFDMAEMTSKFSIPRGSSGGADSSGVPESISGGGNAVAKSSSSSAAASSSAASAAQSASTSDSSDGDEGSSGGGGAGDDDD